MAEASGVEGPSLRNHGNVGPFKQYPAVSSSYEGEGWIYRTSFLSRSSFKDSNHAIVELPEGSNAEQAAE